MRIKICGLTRMEDIEAVNRALPDYAGFVFAESPRRISREGARELRRGLRREIPAVGVFVDAPLEEIAAFHGEGIVDMIQLHGHEDPGYVEALKARCAAPVVKALRLQEGEALLPWEGSAADFLLLDSGAGSGVPFDWGIIGRVDKPFFLAGGINLGNIRAAMAMNPWGIDVSSGAETGGRKDPEKILALTREVKG